MATTQGKEIILTREAFENCQKKLDYFKTHQRKAVAERIKLAKEFGDLSENAEYEDAKNEQAFIEGEILNLENTIRYAKVIDEKEVIRDIVNLGLTACIKDMETGETFEMTLVGSLESDPSNGYISNESPIGKALLGAKKNQIVEAQTPGGTAKFKVLAIKK